MTRPATRLFHARIGSRQWLLLGLLLVLTLYAAWHRQGLALAVGALMLVVVIERMIHTTYTLSADSLTIHTSRFAADRVVPIAAIERIERMDGPRLMGRALHSCLAVSYTAPDGRSCLLSVRPANEADFVRAIEVRRQFISNQLKTIDQQ